MYAGNVLLKTLSLVLILDSPWTSDSEPDNCTIAVKRRTIVINKSINTITINCSVIYCKERPELFWQKGQFKVNSGERHNASWPNNNLFVLTISPVHQNDSGHYHCEGKAGNHTLCGHSIEIIIQGENEQFENATNTTEGEKSKQWIIYTMSALGVLFLLILSCSVLLYFAQKHPVKNKKTDDILQSEMKVFSIYADVQNCNDSTIHDSDEGPTSHQGAKSCLLSFRDRSTNYNNDDSCLKTSGKILDTECDYSILTIHQALPTTEEALLYATLNHDKPFQRSEPSGEQKCIEYAAIGMKK